MDIKALRFLVAVRDAGTVTRAAEHLGITRQAAGRMLRRIEAQAGGPLFERRAGQLRPTELGEAATADARDIVERFDDFTRAYLRPFGDTLASRPISVALVSGGSEGLPAAFLERFALACPGVRLEVDEMSTDAVLESVSNRTAEVGIVGSHPELLPGFELCCIQRMGTWLLVPPGHPLAVCDEVGVTALQGMPFVTAGRHNHLHQFFMRRCAEEGVTPDVRANVTQGSMILKLSRDLGALCFGFPPHVSPPPPGFASVHLRMRGGDEFGTYAIRLARPQSSAARRLWRYAQAYEGGSSPA